MGGGIRHPSLLRSSGKTSVVAGGCLETLQSNKAPQIIILCHNCIYLSFISIIIFFFMLLKLEFNDTFNIFENIFFAQNCLIEDF